MNRFSNDTSVPHLSPSTKPVYRNYLQRGTACCLGFGKETPKRIDVSNISEIIQSFIVL